MGSPTRLSARWPACPSCGSFPARWPLPFKASTSRSRRFAGDCGGSGPRRQRAKGRGTRPRHRPARQRRGRLPRWSRRFDRELVGRLRHSGRDCRCHRRRAPERAGRATDPQARAIDIDAHDLYLKGMYALNKWTESSMARALADFREAIARDAGLAPAYAALAEGHVWLYAGLGILPATDTIPQARSAVETALDLDPTLATHIRFVPDCHEPRLGSKGRGRRARACARPRPWLGGDTSWNAWRLALFERQHDLALIELDAAERLNPLDLQVKTQIGYIHLFHHRFDSAIEQFERVLSLEPAFAFAHYALGDACTLVGPATTGRSRRSSRRSRSVADR